MLAQISPAIPQPPPQALPSASETAKDSAANESEPDGLRTDASQPKPAKTEATDSAFHVELSAIERTWLSIVADGRETFSGILEPAETKVLEGHETARIRTGNAGAINFVFNGKPIGTLGPRGQVRTVVFTKDNYEVLEGSPPVAMTHSSPNAE